MTIAVSYRTNSQIVYIISIEISNVRHLESEIIHTVEMASKIGAKKHIDWQT